MLDNVAEEIKQIWVETLADIKRELSASDYDAWFSKLHLIEI